VIRLRNRILVTLLFGCGVVFSSGRTVAQSNNLREDLARAKGFEALGQWEAARQIYELHLNVADQGLRIRENYYHVLRRCFQIRRHEDLSYRKEVLSIEYGQALRICNIINNTLLTNSVEKKKIDAAKIFRKGLEELDAALANQRFQEEYIPEPKRIFVVEFRSLLKKARANAKSMSQRDVAKQIGEIAMAAELHLQLSPTVIVMEFACGACYAVDDYTVYLTPNQLRELTLSLAQSEILPLGMIISKRDDKLIVMRIELDSPARGRIQENDEIVSVDRQLVAGLRVEKVRELLNNGPIGSFVEIEVMTPGLPGTRLPRVERRAMLAQVIPSIVDKTDVGVIKVTGFTSATLQEIDDAIVSLSNPRYGMKRLILDLRQNNGGIFDSAIETARRFLSTGIIASEIHHDGRFKIHQAKNADAFSTPLIVLVDGDTASAAEVLAGALKENGRAILIGQTTYGKGCTQDILKLPNAPGNVPTGGMKLTISRFFSPKGNAYSGRGVTPHIFIDDRMAESQANMMGDAYVQRAIEEFNRMSMLMK
jgi:carboxyl-terminal processing protease